MMAGRCEQCQEPTNRAVVRVRASGDRWVERLPAIVCRSCGFIRLTEAGHAKLARAQEAGPTPAPALVPLEVVRVYGP